MVGILTTSLLASSKHFVLSPALSIKQPTHSVTLLGSVFTDSTVLSWKTKITEKKMTSVMMINTMAMPRHWS